MRLVLPGTMAATIAVLKMVNQERVLKWLVLDKKSLIARNMNTPTAKSGMTAAKHVKFRTMAKTLNALKKLRADLLTLQNNIARYQLW